MTDRKMSSLLQPHLAPIESSHWLLVNPFSASVSRNRTPFHIVQPADRGILPTRQAKSNPSLRPLVVNGLSPIWTPLPPVWHARLKVPLHIVQPAGRGILPTHRALLAYPQFQHPSVPPERSA